MHRMQCPAGEHCPRKERGAACLMWHPPVEEKYRDQRQLEIAIQRSLQPQKVLCQFCKTEVDNIDELHLHQMECYGIEGSGVVKGGKSEAVGTETDDLPRQQHSSQPDEFTGLGNPDIYAPSVKRKSSSCRMSHKEIFNSSDLKPVSDTLSLSIFNNVVLKIMRRITGEMMNGLTLWVV